MPGEPILNPQPERKIDLTILDKHIAHIFADSNAELGVCNVAEHKINTGDAKPVPQHSFSSSRKAREINHQQVVDMDKHDIIDRSFSLDTQQRTSDETL